MFRKVLLKKILVKVIIILMSYSSTAYGADVVLYLDTHIFDTAPVGPSPWTKATFSDAGSGKVNLLLEAINLTDNEFIDDWYFNFDPSEDSSDLNFTRIGSPPPTLDRVDSANNVENIDGDSGDYDIRIRFDLDDFTDNRSMLFEIDYTSALTPSMFYFKSDGGDYYSAAQIKDINGSDRGNIAAPAPEPATYIQIATLLAFIAFLKKKRERATVKFPST